MIDHAAFLIDPRRLWAGESVPELPMALVDCDAARDWPAELVLPTFPVIALGPRTHPLAARLDAVIEPPVPLASLLRNVLAHPRAAATLVDLLRLLPRLTPADGLVAESLAYATLQGSAEHAHWLASRPSPPHAAPGTVQITRTGETLALRLNRPAAGNAIDRPMRDVLAEALAFAALDPTITRIHLAGAGRAFSLGADLAEFGTTRDPATAHAIRRRTLPAPLAAACASRLESHVHGACVGAGLELAAFAARLTATPRAWFQLPELAMGLLPGAGGCVSLTSRIGRQRTALMVLSGRRIAAPVALDWGLVDELVNEHPADHRGADII